MLTLGTAGARWDSSINSNDIDFLIASFYRYVNQHHIYVGFDARPQSAILARRAKILIDIDPDDNRVSLINDKPITTPMLCQICKEHHSYGMMFTASHNPLNYVGVKFITPQGTIIDENDVKNINNLESHIETTHIDVTEFYKYLYSNGCQKDHYSISTLGGAARGYVGDIFCGNVIEDNTPAVGNSLEPRADNIILPLPTAKYGIAFALDGDGDRLVMFIDGLALTPSETFMLFIKAVSQFHLLSKVIATFNLSNLIEQYCSDLDISFEWSPVGFQHIIPKYDNSFIVAGEESGGLALHPIFSDRDGIAAAIILMDYNESVGLRKELKHIREKYGRMRYQRYDLNTNTSISDCVDALAGYLGTLQQDQDGIKYQFGLGWIMFRKSGTEPLIRIYCETPWNDDFDLKQFIDGKI
jgi:phosphomannomutase